MGIKIDDFEQEVMLSEEEISEIVANLAQRISKDYKDKKLLLVGILKGAYVFMSDLSRKITVGHEIDFMRVSTYGEDTNSSGSVRILMDLSNPIVGLDVIVVEDILDTGVTLDALQKVLLAQNPNSLELCTLLDKPERRVAKDVKVKYVGKEIPDEFVIGYGLDANEQGRNYPYIAALKLDKPKNR